MKPATLLYVKPVTEVISMMISLHKYAAYSVTLFSQHGCVVVGGNARKNRSEFKNTGFIHTNVTQDGLVDEITVFDIANALNTQIN